MTTTTPPNLSIPALNETNFSTWLVATTSAAKKALPTNGPLGGLGLLLPPREYAALNQNEEFVPAVKPATVSNAETTYKQATYDREQVALAALTAAVYDSLPMATLQACPGYDPTFGASFISLPRMMEHVRNKHSWTTSHHYHQAKAALLTPLVIAPGTDIDTFLATHVDAHLACKRADNALNQIEKVDALIAAVGGRTGPFALTINTFEEATPRLHMRTFEDTADLPAQGEHEAVPARIGLATRIREAAPRIFASASPSHPTTRGYFGAAATFREELTATLRDILPSMLNTANATTLQPMGQQQQQQQQSRRARTKYCWSHGLCAHTGKDCRNPSAGHDIQATVQNRRGGSSKGCRGHK